jgi:hypothetical protein
MESIKGNIYQRLNHAITNAPTNELCTSSIHDGDIAFKNYFGGIGLIIKNPTIIFSSPKDGGTFRLENGVLIFNDEIGTENPSLIEIEHAIQNRETYNEFRVIKYNAIGIFFSLDYQGWPIATQTIKSDFQTFYEKTKAYGLPYYFFDKGALSLVGYNNSSQRFEVINTCNAVDLYN